MERCPKSIRRWKTCFEQIADCRFRISEFKLEKQTFLPPLHLWERVGVRGQMTREEKLQREGWEKRFTIDEPRLSEMVEQYKELGFEVLLEPVDTSSEECTSCIVVDPKRYKTIYTRKKN